MGRGVVVLLAAVVAGALLGIGVAAGLDGSAPSGRLGGPIVIDIPTPTPSPSTPVPSAEPVPPLASTPAPAAPQEPAPVEPPAPVPAPPAGGGDDGDDDDDEWADGERHETLAASTGVLGPAASSGVLSLTDGDREVSVWRFPDDPGLPALAAALHAPTLSGLLTSFGVSQAGSVLTPEAIRTSVRAYRPRRRAVVEVQADLGDRTAHLFLKVQRPRHIEALHERHRLLHDAGVPVPRSLGWTDEGLLVLSALAGDGMRERMRARGDLPSAKTLVDVLDRLPEGVVDLPRRRSWTEGVDHYADVVASTLPSQTLRVRDLAARIASGTADADDQPVPTHGDFYEAQLLLDGHGAATRVSGVLDVDTAGPGRRADDLACMLAHASLLATIETGHAEATAAVRSNWLRAMETGPRAVDPRDLRLRVAGVLLTLATGPFRVQEKGWRRGTLRRVDLVECWVDAADRSSA